MWSFSLKIKGLAFQSNPEGKELEDGPSLDFNLPKAGRMRWLDSITDSMDMNLSYSGRKWRTGKPGVLQSIGRKVSDMTQWLNNNKAKLSWCLGGWVDFQKSSSHKGGCEGPCHSTGSWTRQRLLDWLYHGYLTHSSGIPGSRVLGTTLSPSSCISQPKLLQMIWRHQSQQVSHAFTHMGL